MVGNWRGYFGTTTFGFVETDAIVVYCKGILSLSETDIRVRLLKGGYDLKNSWR
jgi:hypothetical protein